MIEPVSGAGVLLDQESNNTKEKVMKHVTLALLAAVLALLAVAPTQAAAPKLVGTAGPDFTITLTKNGARVRKLKAGTYSITVNDRASIHDFHLSGPGVNKKTSVTGTGRSTWVVTLQKSKTYRFVCDPHASIMKGSFTTF
jgi:plastocyanin